MRIAIGSDRAACDHKERLELFLIEIGHEIVDFSARPQAPSAAAEKDSPEPSGCFPPCLPSMAQAVAEGEFDRAVVLSGSADGAAILANRMHGVRCIAGWCVKEVRRSRRRLDANLLALDRQLLPFEKVRDIVEAWLETPFDAPRHAATLCLFEHPPSPPAPDTHTLPRRAAMEPEALYVCDSCRTEFVIAIDPLEGGRQDFVEDCPVCCHPNVVHVEIDGDGLVLVSGQAE